MEDKVLFVKKISPIALGFVLLIALWQLAVIIGGHHAALFPPPLKVGQALIGMVS